TQSRLVSAVELRLGKIGASFAQDLIGLAKLAVLPLQGLELGGYVRGQARLEPAVALGLANPLMQRLRSADDLARNRAQRCPTRRMFMLMIQNHPRRAGSHLRRELVRCLACHGSTLSRVGAPGKPGAVHLLDHTKAERKSEVEPNGITYHLIREAMTAVHGTTSSWHGPRLATRPSNSVNV